MKTMYCLPWLLFMLGGVSISGYFGSGYIFWLVMLLLAILLLWILLDSDPYIKRFISMMGLLMIRHPLSKGGIDDKEVA